MRPSCTVINTTTNIRGMVVVEVVQVVQVVQVVVEAGSTTHTAMRMPMRMPMEGQAPMLAGSSWVQATWAAAG